MLRRPLRNALLLLSGEGITRLIGFATTALLARRLGVDTFGQLGFATAVLAYGVAVSDFGLVTTGTRRAAENQDNPLPVTRSVLGVRLMAGVAAAVLVAIASFVVPKPHAVRLLVASYAVVTVLQALSLEWLFFGLERTGRVAVARALTSATYFVACLLLVRGPTDLLIVPAAFAASIAFGVALLATGASARFSVRILLPTLRGWGSVLRASWPVGLAGVLTQVHVNCGIIFLGLLRTDHETGLFAGASKLVMVFLALDRVFYTVFLPAITRAFVDSEDRVGELLSTGARIGLATGLPLFVAAAVLAPWALRLVMGPEYVAAAGAMRILAVYLPLTMVNSAFGYTVVAGSRETSFLKNVAASAAVSVVASLALTVTVGAVGAAVALVLGEAVMVVLMATTCGRASRLRLGARFFAPLFAGALMAAVMLPMNGLPVAALLAGLAVYGAALLATRGVTVAELTSRGG